MPDWFVRNLARNRKPVRSRCRLNQAAFRAVEHLEQRTLFAAVSFTTQNITTSADGAHGVFVADINEDGFDDFLAAVEGQDTVTWYRSNAGNGFIAQNITTTASEVGAASAVDLDGDGDIDVLAAAKTGHLTWHENSGSGTFSSHNVTATAVGANAVMAGDIDGDNDIDLVADNASGDKLVWYENNGSESFTERTIQSSAGVVKSVYVIDIDGDDDLDVVSGSEQSDSVILYLNNGSGTFTTRPIDVTMTFCLSVFAADLNGDGDIDILATSLENDTVAWYENDGSEVFTKHGITSNADGASGVYVADIDGDGDKDVLSSNFVNDHIDWYDNTNGDATAFTVRGISAAADQAQDVSVGDFDNDGDLDVVSASYRDDKIAVYTSGLATSPPTSPPPTSPPPTSPPPTSPPPTSPPPTSPPPTSPPPPATFVLEAAASGTLPTSAVAGAKTKGKISVTVSNPDPQAFFNAPVTVRLFASADDVLDGSDSELTAITKRLKIAAGKFKTVKLPVKSFPATLADGSYKVVAEVTPLGSTATTAATSFSTVVAAPFFNLSGTAAGPAKLTPGKNAKFILSTLNSGNVKLTATAQVTIEAALDGNLAARVPVATVPAKFNILPGKTKKVSLKFLVPENLAAGSYTLVATLDSGNTVLESNESDNQVVSSTASLIG